MKKIKRSITFILLLFLSTIGFSQELSITKSATANVNTLPEYIVITSENTKLLGGIDIIIDYKRSAFKQQLRNLEELLQDGDKLRVRNQTDLLNAMSTLGFEYVNGYNSGATSYGSGDDILGEDAKFRTNMVFRKKLKYRKL